MFRPLTQGWRGLLPSVALLSTRSISSGTSTDVKFAGKVAVITGSTNGIGLAIARRLAQDGAHVVISSRKQQNVDRAVAALQGEGLSVTGTVCHVGKAEDRERLVARALEHCGGVDFLVCTAGVNPLVGSTLGSSEQVWDKDATHHVHARQEGQHLPTPLVRGHRAHLLTQRPSSYLEKILNINVKAPALLLSQLLPHMEKRGQGSVVLVSSISAYVSLARLGAYNVSKTALLGLTKTLAVELAPKNIRVNCLVPGIIKTPFSQVLSTYPTFVDYLTELYGVHRKGQPEDCAGLVSFLCSPDASYISGENIVVAGFSPHL